jgi:large subunit ribosomal protein L23
MALFTKKQSSKEAKNTTPTSVPAFARQVVVRPHMTEKSLRLAHDRQYVFVIDSHASKKEAIKQIEKTYSVKVIKSTVSVKTENRPHFRGVAGSEQKIKKITVTLAPGQHIDITGSA